VFGAVALMTVLVVVVRSNDKNTFPSFASFDDYLKKVVDKSLVAGLAPGDKLCFVGEPFETEYLAYAVQLRGDQGYAIRSVYEKSECGDYRVVEKEAPVDSSK
jgi:hypothetical protein